MVEFWREMRDLDSVSPWNTFPALNQWIGQSYLFTMSSFLHVVTQYLTVPLWEGKRMYLFNARYTVIFITGIYCVLFIFHVFS